MLPKVIPRKYTQTTVLYELNVDKSVQQDIWINSKYV